MKGVWLATAVVCISLLQAAYAYEAEAAAPNPFRQLDDALPTPNEQRTASGAPGPGYWQQRADYVIDVEIDEATHTLSGRETVTYHNNSPHALAYLWLQLDQNRFATGSASRLTTLAPDFSTLGYRGLQALLDAQRYVGDVQIETVLDGSGAPLPHLVAGTAMRIDLPELLQPGRHTSFSISWRYRISSSASDNGRTGYEIIGADGHAIYTLAQWYPRMAAYTDAYGWQTKPFLGRGEFALEFGDYLVRVSVPADHIVAATGLLQNPEQVLTAAQRERLREAASASKPVFIVRPEEARKAERGRSRDRKTWIYQAQNVRDFAFASSRKYAWDAMAVSGQTWAAPGEKALGGATRPVLAMSFYPNEAGPLWPQYSTHAVAHALEVYSRFTFPYPYPVAISVSAPTSGSGGGRGSGMEYPMISFNAPLARDGTYDRDEKYAFISVIIHETGHNYFPMIVNNDERQWMWMDEGLTTFVESVAQQEWQKRFHAEYWIGTQSAVAAQMRSNDRYPIMSASDEIKAALAVHLGYAKPSLALKVLRESILGRERFDHAFRTYAQRWQFKRPYPADFFRTMEDASGMDLDWFWRGWFYGTGYVDLALGIVREYELDTQDPTVEKPRAQARDKARVPSITELRNAADRTRVEKLSELQDFYDRFDPASVLPSEQKAREELLRDLRERHLDPKLLHTDRRFYAVEIENRGGVIMPVVLLVQYKDGTRETLHIPAEVWRNGDDRIAKLLVTQQEIVRLELDPQDEMADAEQGNNIWAGKVIKERFQLQLPKRSPNPMRELQ